jgi:hypothetical protein
VIVATVVQSQTLVVELLLDIFTWFSTSSLCFLATCTLEGRVAGLTFRLLNREQSACLVFSV